LGADLFVTNKPYLLKYKGQLYFPIAKFYPASTFGQFDFAEPSYFQLYHSDDFRAKGNWMIRALVPFSPNESMDNLPGPPPTRPSKQNLLGTDDRGRDLLARLIYGFRNSMIFALISWAFIAVLAYVTGALQGYFGGRVDLWGQRATEIWGALPVLYVIVFLLSIFPPSLTLLTIIWVVFGWMGLSSYVRVEVLRVRQLEFVLAAKSLGASTFRVLTRHVLPNTLTPLITFSPFIISGSIGGLAALDYLGLGLPPPTASWGELLRQGKDNIDSWWLVFFPFLFLFQTLLLLNFIGEGVRSAFDSKSA
jgi:microcin C transport system permease protein